MLFGDEDLAGERKDVNLCLKSAKELKTRW